MRALRTLLLAALAACLALPAGAARAADPIMPLSEVRAGMRCTGLSVIQGTAVTSFDVQVLDVVGADAGSDGPRILVRVSGPAVDATGIGPGFSGSPVRCPDAAGTPRTIGAISETIGEYGGKVVLATPIEQILGTPVGAPAGQAEPTRRERALLARARPLAAPLTVSGLSAPLARALARAGRLAGRPVLAAPARPLAAFPVQTLRPGSAMGVGYSSGDVSVGAIGTVAYVDGSRVWGFGHGFEAGGARELLLQDAYVYAVIGNPNAGGDAGSTYKLASLGHVVGTLTDDRLSAVAGRTDRAPSTVPVRARVIDTGTGRTTRVGLDVADESRVNFPTGPNLPFVGPLALLQGVTANLGAAPPILTGELCARIGVRQRRAPLRFCNRYVTAGGPAEDEVAPLAMAAASDLSDALGLVDGYERAALRVRRVDATLELVRARRELALRGVRFPARVRPGARVRVRLRVQPVRAAVRTLTVRWRVPRDLPAGSRKLTLRGAGGSGGSDELEDLTALIEGDESAGGRKESRPPDSLEALARAVRRIGRWDGLQLRAAGKTRRFYRDPDWRITGRASARVRVAG
jgi:hypothetical protein